MGSTVQSQGATARVAHHRAGRDHPRGAWAQIIGCFFHTLRFRGDQQPLIGWLDAATHAASSWLLAGRVRVGRHAGAQQDVEQGSVGGGGV